MESRHEIHVPGGVGGILEIKDDQNMVADG
jgi:hypothetical protein